MNKEDKAELRVSYEEKLAAANGIMITEYRGMSVSEITELRLKLREVDGTFEVCKNRVVKKAIEQKVEEAKEVLEDCVGPSALIYLNGDAAAGAKKVLEFRDKTENFKVKVGLFDGEKLDEKQIKAIADLPSKDVLLAQIIGSLVSPHRGLLNVLTGVPRQMVQVINAIKDKKQS